MHMNTVDIHLLTTVLFQGVETLYWYSFMVRLAPVT